jgi:hypothetical protein
MQAFYIFSIHTTDQTNKKKKEKKKKKKNAKYDPWPRCKEHRVGLSRVVAERLGRSDGLLDRARRPRCAVLADGLCWRKLL